MSKTTYDHSRTILHFDVDCFYAQVEEVRNPVLKDKPLGVFQKHIVVTSNYNARKYGVTKCMTITEAKKLCPNLVLVNGEDLINYRRMSQSIFDVVHEYGSAVEKLGFDENYIDVTDLVNTRLSNKTITETEHNFHTYPPNTSVHECDCGCGERLLEGALIAEEIRKDLFDKLMIKTCAGISHNKLLAKLVGSVNKPNSQTILVAAYDVEFMRSLERLSKITGIGQKMESLLLESGVSNITELQNCDLNILKRKIGADYAVKLRQMSLGRDNCPVRPSGKPKSIGLEDALPVSKPMTLKKDVEEKFRLLLVRLLTQVAEDGRIPITVKITVRKFDAVKRTNHRESKQCNLPSNLFKPTVNSHTTIREGGQETILDIVMKLFERLVDMEKAFNITLLGLAFSKFQDLQKGPRNSTIANFLIKKSDLEVQSITNLVNKEPIVHTGDQFTIRRTPNVSPAPSMMSIDADAVSVSSADFSDYSENEVEPSPKKSKLAITKRKLEDFQISSPSKLKVNELHLSSALKKTPINIPLPTKVEPFFKDLPVKVQTDLISSWTHYFRRKVEDGLVPSLNNVPLPSNVEPFFKDLPLDVQTDLLTSWSQSIGNTSLNLSRTPNFSFTEGGKVSDASF